MISNEEWPEFHVQDNGPESCGNCDYACHDGGVMMCERNRGRVHRVFDWTHCNHWIPDWTVLEGMA